MLEYKINDFLTLKLEEGITRIYVKGEEFLQCIRLAINIPISNTLMYDEVESIDQASEIYERIVHENQLLTKDQTFQGDFLEITPEQEFWGHCSNLQVWVEHQYDTHLLQNIILRVSKGIGSCLNLLIVLRFFIASSTSKLFISIIIS